MICEIVSQTSSVVESESHVTAKTNPKYKINFIENIFKASYKRYELRQVTKTIKQIGWLLKFFIPTTHFE